MVRLQDVVTVWWGQCGEGEEEELVFQRRFAELTVGWYSCVEECRAGRWPSWCSCQVCISLLGLAWPEWSRAAGMTAAATQAVGKAAWKLLGRAGKVVLSDSPEE